MNSPSSIESAAAGASRCAATAPSSQSEGAVWIIVVRTDDCYEWSEWPVESHLSEAAAAGRVAELTAGIEAVKAAWPACPTVDDDDEIWEAWKRDQDTALARMPEALVDLSDPFATVRADRIALFQPAQPPQSGEAVPPLSPDPKLGGER